MSPENHPEVNLIDKNYEIRKVDSDILIQHFRKLGLVTSGLNLSSVRFAEFEIFENSDDIKIEVKRSDGNLTRCYLAKKLHSTDVYLQVASKITSEDPNYGSEVHGIFPVDIIAVRSTGHLGSHCYDTLDFVTDNGGTIGVKDDGTIDFGQ